MFWLSFFLFYRISSITNRNYDGLAPKIVSEYNQELPQSQTADNPHTGQCKSTGGCYNELVVAYFDTGGGVKWRKR